MRRQASGTSDVQVETLKLVLFQVLLWNFLLRDTKECFFYAFG